MTYILLPINVLLKTTNQITSYVLVKGYIIHIILIKGAQLLTNNHSGNKIQTLFIFKDNLDINMWHKKMGHIGEQHLKLTLKIEMVRRLKRKPQKNLIFCPSYLHEKQFECNKVLICQSRRAKEIWN
jgi:hypothetical protein